MEPDLIDLEYTEQQSGANLTPLHIIDIIEQNTDDLLVQTSSQPHSNIIEPPARWMQTRSHLKNATFTTLKCLRHHYQAYYPKKHANRQSGQDPSVMMMSRPKKAKIDRVTCPFVVPFSQRKAIDGTFASYSRGFQLNNNNRLTSIIEHTELNTHLLQNNSNIIVSKSLSPIIALVTMQGSIGVPKLLAYRFFDRNFSHIYLLETTNLTEMPVPALPLKDMIAQYAKALIEQHKHCLSLSRDCGIRWKGQEIKFIQWNYCGFRGDCIASSRDKPADSMLDLVHFGNAIQRWSERLISTEFLPLANNLMNACPYQRVSPEYVLRVLENPNLLDQAVKLPRKSFKYVRQD